MRKSIIVVVVLLTVLIGHQMWIAKAELALLEAQRKAVIAQNEEGRVLAARLPEVARAAQALGVKPSAEDIEAEGKLEPFVCPEVGPSRVWLPVVRNTIEKMREELEEECAVAVRLDPIVRRVKTYKAIITAAEDTKK